MSFGAATCAEIQFQPLRFVLKLKRCKPEHIPLKPLIRYNKLRKFQNRRIENSPQNKGQGQRHLVE